MLNIKDLNDNQILIFHHDGKQSEGLYWMLLTNKSIDYVSSWSATSPIYSSQDIEHVVQVDPSVFGRTQLPRFYLYTRGNITLSGNIAVIDEDYI